jgi:predicted TPR repeat methyltransferase
MENAVVDVD